MFSVLSNLVLSPLLSIYFSHQYITDVIDINRCLKMYTLCQQNAGHMLLRLVMLLSCVGRRLSKK